MIRKYASMEVLAAHLGERGPSMQKVSHRAEFDYDAEPGYLYVRSRAISSRVNDNYDRFDAPEIKKAYRTFIGKPVFVNHHNEDHRKARGVIIDAALHEDTNPDGTPDTWAEVLHKVDATTFPRLAMAVISGDVDHTSMGCFIPGTLVTMADGTQRPIETLEVGDEVLTHTGKTEPITYVMVKPHHGIVYDLKVYGQATPLVMTDEHPVWVRRTAVSKTSTVTGRTLRTTEVTTCSCGRDFASARSLGAHVRESVRRGYAGTHEIAQPEDTTGWVEAKDVQPGDWVLTPVPAGVGHPGSYPFARLLGFYLAEGNLGWDRKRTGYENAPVTVEWTFDAGGFKDEIEHVQEVVVLLQAMGYSAAGPYKKNNAYSIRCNSPELAARFLAYGGQHSWSKRLHPDVLRWEPDNQAALLDAYLLGDAHWSEGEATHVSAGTASQHLAQQLQLLAVRTGVSMTPATKQHSPSAVAVGSRAKYVLQASMTPQLNPVSQTERNGLAKVDEHGLWRQVTGIVIKEYQGNVYNFDVEGDDSYIAADVAVHNCDIEFSRCTFCGNEAVSPNQYCSHIPGSKGQRISRGGQAILVAENCLGLSFFENSLLVEPPADPTARAFGVDYRGLTDNPIFTTAIRVAAAKSAATKAAKTAKTTAAGWNSVPPPSEHETFTPDKVTYPHARTQPQTYEELMVHLLRDHDQHERTDNGYVPDGSFDHTALARAAALLKSAYRPREDRALGWAGSDSDGEILRHDLGIKRLDELKQARHPTTGFGVNVGIHKRLVPNSSPPMFQVKDYGNFGANGQTPFFATDKGQVPVKFVYRGMSEAEYTAYLKNGYIQSNGQGNIADDEGTCASHDPRSALTYGHDSNLFRVVKIRVDPSGGWRVDPRDSYIKTNQPIPAAQVVRVTRSMGEMQASALQQSAALITEARGEDARSTTEKGLGWGHQQKREQALAKHRNGDPCPICHKQMLKSQGLHLDHSRARSLPKGGMRTRLTHSWCNQSRGNGTRKPGADSRLALTALQRSASLLTTASDYRGQHQPPEDGPTLDHLDDGTMFPDDVYDHPEYYGGSGTYGAPSVQVAREVQGKPDAPVTIYRAVPSGVTEINTGDWVSIIRSYAALHAESMNRGASGAWHVLSAQVPAHTVRNGGNDLVEYGYWGPSVASARISSLQRAASHLASTEEDDDMTPLQRSAALLTQAVGSGNWPLDRPVTDVGMTHDPASMDIAEVAAAKTWGGWNTLPTTQVTIAGLRATEAAVASHHVDKVVKNGEPFREGYDPYVLITTDGAAYLIDGHTRALMYGGLGQTTMPAKVLDLRTQKMGAKRHDLHRHFGYCPMCLGAHSYGEGSGDDHDGDGNDTPAVTAAVADHVMADDGTRTTANFIILALGRRDMDPEFAGDFWGYGAFQRGTMAIIGQILWAKNTHVIGDLQVIPEFQRQGVAKALYEAAKAQDPRIQHSNDYTEDGAGFVNSIGGNARMSAARYAYGEQVAPTPVDTLRQESCPVCGEDNSYTGDECAVCGFVKPPDRFGDPDLTKAKENDLRGGHTDGEVTQKLECDHCGAQHEVNDGQDAEAQHSPMSNPKTSAAETMPVPDTLWDKQGSKRYSDNESKAFQAGLAPCTMCGRGLNPATLSKIMVVNGGDMLHPNHWAEADESDAGFMGLYDLGPECAKKIPVAFKQSAGKTASVATEMALVERAARMALDLASKDGYATADIKDCRRVLWSLGPVASGISVEDVSAAARNISRSRAMFPVAASLGSRPGDLPAEFGSLVVSARLLKHAESLAGGPKKNAVDPADKDKANPFAKKKKDDDDPDDDGDDDTDAAEDTDDDMDEVKEQDSPEQDENNLAEGDACPKCNQGTLHLVDVNTAEGTDADDLDEDDLDSDFDNAAVPDPDEDGANQVIDDLDEEDDFDGSLEDDDEDDQDDDALGTSLVDGDLDPEDDLADLEDDDAGDDGREQDSDQDSGDEDDLDDEDDEDDDKPDFLKQKKSRLAAASRHPFA